MTSGRVRLVLRAIELAVFVAATGAMLLGIIQMVAHLVAGVTG